MSGSASIGLEQAILGHTLGFSTLPATTTAFVALCALAPAPTEVTGGAEASGGSYSRVPATFALVDAPANLAANVASVEWPVATASWGTMGYFELWDRLSGGNRLYWGQLLDPVAGTPVTVTVVAGDIVRFSAGALAVQAATGTGGTTSAGAYLPLIGGTLTGPLTLAADPTLPLVAATKQYVDGRLASGSATAAVVNVLNHGAYGDGVHDDTAAIQNTLNAYTNTAAVFVPNTGSPYMVAGLTLPSGTDLLLYGTLKLQPNSSGPAVSLSGATRVSIRGSGIIDGNSSAQTAGNAAGLAVSLSANVRVSGITLQNAFYWNLNVTQSNNVVVDGVTFIGGGAANEFAAASNDCWLTNCIFDGTGNGDYAFCFYIAVTNSGAIGNTIGNAGAGTTSTPPAIGVLNDSGANQPCQNIVIANNILHDSGGPGIQVESSSASGVHSGILISGNRCYNNSKIGSGGSGGADILIDYAQGVTIVGNQLSANGNNSGSATQFSGIFLGPNASHISVIGNHIFNTGSHQGTTVSVGLWSFNTAYVHVSGNYFYDDQTTPTMQYSIVGNAGGHSSYVGNFLDRPINLNLQPDTVVSNSLTGVNTLSSNVTVNGIIGLNSPGIRYNHGNAVAFNWVVLGSTNALQFEIDGSVVQTIATMSAIFSSPSAANDAAAATAGVPVGALYRNGSVVMVRMV